MAEPCLDNKIIPPLPAHYLLRQTPLHHAQSLQRGGPLREHEQVDAVVREWGAPDVVRVLHERERRLHLLCVRGEPSA